MSNIIQDEMLALFREMEERYGHEKTRHALEAITITRNGEKQAVGSLRDQMVTLIHRADRGDAVLLEEAKGDHKSLSSAIRAIIAKGNDTWPTTPQPYQDDVRLAKTRMEKRIWFDLQAEKRVPTSLLIKTAQERGYIAKPKKRKKRRAA